MADGLGRRLTVAEIDEIYLAAERDEHINKVMTLDCETIMSLCADAKAWLTLPGGLRRSLR